MCFNAPPAAPEDPEVDEEEEETIDEQLVQFFARKCDAMAIGGVIDPSLFVRGLGPMTAGMDQILEDQDFEREPETSSGRYCFDIKTYRNLGNTWNVPLIEEVPGGRVDAEMFKDFEGCVPGFFLGFQIDALREYFNTDDKKRMAIDRRFDAENGYFRGDAGVIERANFEEFVGGGMKGLAELLAGYSGTDPAALVNVDGVFPVKTFDVLGETWTVPVICDDTVFDKQAVAHIIRCMPKLLYADDAAALLAQY